MADRDERDFPHASIVEGLRFSAQVAVPNLIQGLVRRRRAATAVAERAGADGLAAGFMASLKRSYGNGPLWIRVGGDELLLVLGREATQHVLQSAPDPFAADAEPKRSAMTRFQPHALTISRGSDWVARRRFTDAVLEAGAEVHSLGERFVAAASQEARGLPEQASWETWNACVRRVARRVILGDGAADDDGLSALLGELMDKANPPGHGDEELLAELSARIDAYVASSEPGSLVARFAAAPVGERTRPARQVTHWLFALGDTLAIGALRCLTLLAAFEAERARVMTELEGTDLGSPAAVAGLTRLRACLHEALRLWPTTAILSREAVRDTDWDGVNVSAGTVLMIVNSFNHRDREALDYADRFSPEQWISGTATDDWMFNHFSHGPQGCPGAALALLVGQAMLATVLRERSVELLAPALDPSRPLPHSLDHFGIRLRLA